MKFLKSTFFVSLLVLVFTGCGRDLGFSPSGTSLSLSLSFPESGASGSSRLIHSESDLLTVSLTYPDGNVIEAEFERSDSESTLEVLVEELEPADGVELYVSLGLAEGNLILSDASSTIDIVQGESIPVDLILEPVVYDIEVTFKDRNGSALTDYTLLYDKDMTGSTYKNQVTTDSSGKLPMSISTDNLYTYTFYEMSISQEEATYYMARNGLQVLQSGPDYEIVARPELFLDIDVVSDVGQPLSGVRVELQYTVDGQTYQSKDLDTTDGNGHMFFHSYDDSALTAFWENVSAYTSQNLIFNLVDASQDIYNFDFSYGNNTLDDQYAIVPAQ